MDCSKTNKAFAIVLMVVTLMTSMANTLTIMQWNARSIRANEPYLHQHLRQEKYDILMLQSLNCKEKELPNIAGFCYPPFSHSRPDEKVYTATYVATNIVGTQNSFANQVEGYHVWTEIRGEKGPINLLNMYFPNGDKEADWLSQKELQTGPWLVAGDFNCHSFMWENECEPQNESTSFRDKIIESELVILNDGTPTRIPDTDQQRLTAVDLTLVTNDLIDVVRWEVGDDPLSSDHLPIKLELNKPPIRSNNTRIKYNYELANWTKFRQCLNDKLIRVEDTLDVEVMNDQITRNIMAAANSSIPQQKNTNPKGGKPWWTKECEKAVKRKSKAYKKYRRHVCPETHMEMKQTKQECKEKIALAKRAYWNSVQYATDDDNNLTTLFKEIKKMKGQFIGSDPKLVDEMGEYVTAQEKANRLAQIFEHTSTFVGLSQEMKDKRAAEERVPILDPPDNNLPINTDITIDELNRALANITKVKVSAGPDALSYRMIRELPIYYKKLILLLFQRCWRDGVIPRIWKSAIITPILKSGKEKQNPNSYRPISLTSHLGKVYERIIKMRLTHYCEKNNTIPKCQAGFMKGRGVSDHLAKFSAKVRRARARKKLLFTVFFDVRRAYDTVWHRKIIQKLKTIGLSGNIYQFVKSFLKERRFKVRWKDALSEEKRTDMGVPQGSVIAPLLFNLVLADIDKVKLPACTLMVYADDVAICYETTLNKLTNIDRNPRFSNHMNIFQAQIHNINLYMKQQGFTLEPTKTQFMIFKGARVQVSPHVTITVDGIQVPHITRARYLGVIFSSNYSWQPHITALIDSTHRATNLIKLLKGQPWASQPKYLVSAAVALVRSRLMFGHEAYFEAPDSLIDKLEVAECQALRIALGVPKYAPRYLVYRESGVLPFTYELRRRCANYMFRFNTVPNSTTFEDLETPKGQPTKTAVTSFSEFVDDITQEANLTDENVAKRGTSLTPPWEKSRQQIALKLENLGKKRDNPYILKNVAYELIDTKYANSTHIYTDGSVGPEGVGSAFIAPSLNYSKKYTLTEVTVFTAELLAIYMSLNFINSKKGIKEWTIFSDSKSSLEAIESDGSSKREDLVHATVNLLSELKKKKTNVTLQWIPSHVGIRGNELADKAAGEAARGMGSIELSLPLAYNDVKIKIKSILWKKWKTQFKKITEERNPLDPSIPIPGGRLDPSLPPVVARLKNRLTMNAWRTRFSNLRCACGHEFTPEHVLLKCAAFYDNMKTLREKVGADKTMPDIIRNNEWLLEATKSILNLHINHFF